MRESEMRPLRAGTDVPSRVHLPLLAPHISVPAQFSDITSTTAIYIVCKYRLFITDSQRQSITYSYRLDNSVAELAASMIDPKCECPFLTSTSTMIGRRH